MVRVLEKSNTAEYFNGEWNLVVLLAKIELGVIKTRANPPELATSHSMTESAELKNSRYKAKGGAERGQ